MSAGNLPTIVLRDGLPVHVAVGGEDEAFSWLLREMSSSASHALAYEGYALLSPEEGNTGRAQTIRGWQAFHLGATRRGYGVPGALARLAVAIQDTVNAYDQDGAKLNDREAGRPDNVDQYTAAELAPMLSAFIGLLNNTGVSESAGAFDAIRHQLDAWARATAVRIGWDGEL